VSKKILNSRANIVDWTISEGLGNGKGIKRWYCYLFEYLWNN